jgi:dolichol kinase
MLKSKRTLTDVEDVIWSILALAGCWKGGWMAWLTLAQLVYILLVPPPPTNTTGTKNQWRPNTNNNSVPEPGHAMSVVLVPSLLHAMARQNVYWSGYAKLTTLVALPQTIIAPLGMLGVALSMDPDPSLRTASALSFLVVVVAVAAGVHWRLQRQNIFEALLQAVTLGEFRVIVSLSTIVLVEWMQRMMIYEDDSSDTTAASTSTSTTSHVFVALSGVVGCALATSLVVTLQLPLYPRMLMQVVGPLVVVEGCLWWHQPQADSVEFPRALNWLLDFISVPENNHARYWGLVYWVVCLVVLALPTMTLLNSKISVVMTRKWFHLVALLLFGPMTWKFPDLLSLSYAIALCGLVVLETLRSKMPALQSFYSAFVDPTKDDTQGGVVLSHMCLIIGCAAPLWIAECCSMDGDDDDSSHQQLVGLLLAQWGVLCLGVGDAMGAVVGKGVGWHQRHQWGKNGRTLEGSSAMWVSMMAVGLLAVPSSDWLALLTATTITTLLEAFTSQMDNLVLPLAGSTVVLLLR